MRIAARTSDASPCTRRGSYRRGRPCRLREERGQKANELLLGHFAGRKGELLVLDLTQTTNVARNLCVIWGIREDDVGLFAGHESGISGSLPRVTTDQAMQSELPNVAGTGHRRDWDGRDVVLWSGVTGLLRGSTNDQIHFTNVQPLKR